MCLHFLIRVCGNMDSSGKCEKSPTNTTGGTLAQFSMSNLIYNNQNSSFQGNTVNIK